MADIEIKPNPIGGGYEVTYLGVWIARRPTIRWAIRAARSKYLRWDALTDSKEKSARKRRERIERYQS